MPEYPLSRVQPVQQHYEPLPPGAPQPRPAETWDMLSRLWRRKGLIAGCTVLCLAAGAAVLATMPPRYTAQATMMLGIPAPRITDIEAVLQGREVTSTTLQSEQYVVASRAVAQRVIDELALHEDPEFNPALREPPAWKQQIEPVKAAAKDFVKSLLPADEDGADAAAAPALPEQVLEDLRRQSVINVLLSRLTVTPLSRSHVMSIAAESEDRFKAARIANAVVAEYIDSQVSQKSETTESANTWLDQQIETLRAQVAEAEQAVQDYRAQYNLYETKSDSLVAQEIAELNGQIASAEGARAEARSQLSQVRRMQEQPGGFDALPSVLASPLIQSLRQAEVELQSELAELASTLGPKHPQRLDVASQLEDVKQRIAGEVGKVVEALRHQAASADARYASLRNRLAELRSELGDNSRQSVRLQELQRKADADRRLLEDFMRRVKETEVQRGVQAPDARMVSAAAVPGVPSYPPDKLILAASGLGGVLLGMLLALFLDRLDGSFRTRDDLEGASGLSTLALVPKVRGRGRRSADRGLLGDPTSTFAAAVRRLHARLELAGSVSHRDRTFMFTSSVPEEGKSAISAAVARLAAHSGRRVILLDCDWQRPVLHRMFGQAASPGLTDLLSGDATPDEVVFHDDRSGAHVMFAGTPGDMPDDAARLRHLPALLQTLSRHYDMVVIDTAPILVGTEASQIAGMVDSVVYVVQWGRTPRQVVMNGLRHMADIGARMGGVVLSQVDARRYRRYGEGDLSYTYPSRRHRWIDGDAKPAG